MRLGYANLASIATTLTRDEPLSSGASRPGGQRAKVLSVRLNPAEFDELTRYAAALERPRRHSYAAGFSISCVLDQSHRSGPSSGSPTNSSSYADNWWPDRTALAIAGSAVLAAADATGWLEADLVTTRCRGIQICYS